MADYKELIEAVIRRQLGILGKKKLFELLKDTNCVIDSSFRLSNGTCSMDDLDELMKMLKKHYGAIAVLGCRMLIIRLAEKEKLKLPSIFD